jgi:hypothetical protein
MFLIAYDYFVKLEAFQHFERTSFFKFLTDVLRGSICSRGGLHYSEKYKAITFTANVLGM